VFQVSDWLHWQVFVLSVPKLK